MSNENDIYAILSDNISKIITGGQKFIEGIGAAMKITTEKQAQLYENAIQQIQRQTDRFGLLLGAISEDDKPDLNPGSIKQEIDKFATMHLDECSQLEKNLKRFSETLGPEHQATQDVINTSIGALRDGMKHYAEILGRPATAPEQSYELN